MKSIEQRLARLERENRSWRLGALAAAVLVGAGLCVAAAPGDKPAAPADGVIRGKTLLLSDGKESASVMAECQGKQAAVYLSSPSGKSSVALVVDDDSAMVRITRTGVGGASLNAAADGVSAIYFDKDDKPRPIAAGR